MSIVALTMNYKQSMKKAARTRQGWVPPAEGQLLVNTDASFDEYSHSGSTGVVIRDNHGGVIAASNKFLPHVADAHMAEAWALHDVCAWLKALVQTKLYVKLIALKW